MKNSKSSIFIGALAIAGFAFVIYLFIKWIPTISPQLLTLGSAAIGFIISKIYESSKDNKQRLYEKKREQYALLLKPFIGVLSGSGIDTSKETIKTAFESSIATILYGSDDVIKTYGNFRNLASNNNKDSSVFLKHLALLLMAMRKDLGNKYSNLDEVSILKMFINMSTEEENKYRQSFKKN